MLPLGQLYLVAEALVSQSGFDREHVGVICGAAFPQRDSSMSECDQPARACECAQCRGVASLRDLVQPYRHYVDVFVPPHASFEVHALLEVIKGDAFSYCEFVVSHKIAV